MWIRLWRAHSRLVEAAAIGLLRCARMWVDADGLESPMFASRAVLVVVGFCGAPPNAAMSPSDVYAWSELTLTASSRIPRRR